MIETTDNRRVLVKSSPENTALPHRTLDLDNIATLELQLLSPIGTEVLKSGVDREAALTVYADRLRTSYKGNENGFRDSFIRLTETLASGQSIGISCSCRNGEMCHADVVKLAVEKLSHNLWQQRESGIYSLAKSEGAPSKINRSDVSSRKEQSIKNPRTARAIAEILGVSETDKLLESINQNEGRSRSEQASHLGRSSQFVRDLYERGANIVDGKLIVPIEKTETSPPVKIATQQYAVKRIGEILNKESKAKEIAPLIVEYGNKIAGATSDGETRVKVFTWMYEALGGMGEFLAGEAQDRGSESTDERFGRNLEEIRGLAAEMHQLEPVDKLELQPLFGHEQIEQTYLNPDESLSIESIYEEAISHVADESVRFAQEEHLASEGILENESNEYIATEGFDRIDLESRRVPQLPNEIQGFGLEKLLENTLPEIDRKLESGLPAKEILKPFREMVYQSAKGDALNKLETIYQKERTTELQQKLADTTLRPDQMEKLQAEQTVWQNAGLTIPQDDFRRILLEHDEVDYLEKRLETSTENRDSIQSRLSELRDLEALQKESKQAKTISQLSGDPRGLSPKVMGQLDDIDLHKPSVISLSTPAEYQLAQEAIENTFFQMKHRETHMIRAKLAEFRESGNGVSGGPNKNGLKKELTSIQELRLSVAYRVGASSQTVTGQPSERALNELSFFSSYINHQLKQPESRLRHENERYRIYAAKLETAKSRVEIIEAASGIRAENATLGLKWKELQELEKQQLPRPLTAKEMQFLFTEISPAHYTAEMTVARLSYAHAGASRRLMAEGLRKGEIKPSPEAQKLVDSLESRLQRKEIKDSISATKHFFESIKTPDTELRYKNRFDHQEVYRKLAPPEKDFVYHRAVQQKENLEYRQIFQREQVSRNGEFDRGSVAQPEISKAEKSFHLLSQFNQALALGKRVQSPALISPDIKRSDFHAISIVLKSNSPESIQLISNELKRSSNGNHRKAAEVLETFSNANIEHGERKTVIQITLPEKRLVEIDTYKELLEKLHPDDERESDKYKISNFSRGAREDSRTRGQDLTITNWLGDLDPDPSATDSPTANHDAERELKGHLLAINQIQDKGRTARSENESLLTKYISRTTTKMEAQKRVVPSFEDRKHLAATALGVLGGRVLPVDRVNRQFFEGLQKEIAVSDFHRFKANEAIVNHNTTQIREIFADVSRIHEIRAANRAESVPAHDANLNAPARDSILSGTPLSLSLYEAEISRAEGQLLAKDRNERLSQLKERVDTIDQPDPNTILTAIEREQIKATAAETAKERLEPKELDVNHGSLRPEASKQAIYTFKQLEKSHHLYLFSRDNAEVLQSFARLDKEAGTLHQIRAAYTKAEKLALVKDGVKSDLVDLLKRNPGTPGSALIDETTNILNRNLAKAEAFTSIRNDASLTVLSREIGEKIECRQELLTQEHSRAGNQLKTRSPASTDRPPAQNLNPDVHIKDRAAGTNIYSR